MEHYEKRVPCEDFSFLVSSLLQKLLLSSTTSRCLFVCKEEIIVRLFCLLWGSFMDTCTWIRALHSWKRLVLLCTSWKVFHGSVAFLYVK